VGIKRSSLSDAQVTAPKRYAYSVPISHLRIYRLGVVTDEVCIRDGCGSTVLVEGKEFDQACNPTTPTRVMKLTNPLTYYVAREPSSGARAPAAPHGVGWTRVRVQKYNNIFVL